MKEVVPNPVPPFHRSEGSSLKSLIEVEFEGGVIAQSLGAELMQVFAGEHFHVR